MRLQIAILVLAASVLPAGVGRAQGARPIPSVRAHKPALKDKHWWIGEAVILASTTLDAQSTCRGFNRGLVEQSFLLRGSQSCRNAVLAIGVGDVVYTALHLWAHKLGGSDAPLGWRIVGDTEVPGIVAAFHLRAAIHNYRVESAPAPGADSGILK